MGAWSDRNDCLSVWFSFLRNGEKQQGSVEALLCFVEQGMIWTRNL